jgi:hypothetical protein
VREQEREPLYKKLGAQNVAEFWTTCARCGKMNNRHAALAPPDAPKDGDSSFCSDCGKWSIYETAALGKLRLPTATEQAEHDGDPRCQQIVSAWEGIS